MTLSRHGLADLSREEWNNIKAKMYSTAFFEGHDERRRQLEKLAQRGDVVARDIMAKLSADEIGKLQRESIGRMLFRTIRRILEQWVGGEGSSASTVSVGGDSAAVPCVVCLEKRLQRPARFPHAAVRELLRRADALRSGRDLGGGGEAAAAASVLTCENGHEVTAETISSSKAVVRESAPCPQCSSQPPGFFSRLRCLTFFDENDTEHMGVSKCAKCGLSTSILEIFPPEVFLSYAWGVCVVKTDRAREYAKQFVVQGLLKAVRTAVELESSALCWLDVGGGLNPGENHINLMKVGMDRAFVAVVFLSDGYVRSANCKRELCQAVSSYKRVIPVLMPPTVVNPDDWQRHEYKDREQLDAAVRDSGWGGPGPHPPGPAPKGWWEHAARVSGGDFCVTPEGDRIEWSALGEFEPLDLRRFAGPAGLTVDGVERLRDHLLLDLGLSARIMAQLSPADCFTEVRRAHQGSISAGHVVHQAFRE